MPAAVLVPHTRCARVLSATPTATWVRNHLGAEISSLETSAPHDHTSGKHRLARVAPGQRRR
jgi:hypothetical protein